METNKPVKNEEINIIKRAVVEQIEELYKKIINEFDIKEEVQELIKSSEKYLDMVDREIMKIKTA